MAPLGAAQRVAGKLLGRTSCDSREMMRLTRGDAVPGVLDLCDAATTGAGLDSLGMEAGSEVPHV